MNISRRNKKRIATYAVYAVLLTGIAWRLVSMLSPMFGWSDPGAADTYLVSVTGNVIRPGQYRVPPGTTPFEILKVAGIRPTSDISAFDLVAQISNNQQLQVGTMPNPVTMKKEPDKIRLEFHTGDVSVIASDGRTRPLQTSMEVNQGDRVLTKEKSQAELSASTFSRIDLDDGSELAFDKIGVSENGKATTWPLQKSGTVWYKIVYASKTELFRITTSLVNVSVAGTGADFTVVVKPDEIDVNTMDGLVLIERINGSEAINLISGQSATIFGDNRPFQVSPMSPETYPTARFSTLTKEKTTLLLRHMPFNFVFCAIPTVFYLGSADFESGKFHIVNFPAETSVGEFIQGCSTLGQAFLYGGGVYVSSIVEQIMNSRVSKYAVLEKGDLIRIAGTLGGVTVDVDEKAAAVLKVKKGVQKLTSTQLVAFLMPNISTSMDFRMRQVQVMKSIFESLTSKSLVVNALVAQQILAAVQSNITVGEVLDEYSKFSAVQNWTFKQHTLPVKSYARAGKTEMYPILDECKTLFQND
jgi:ferric-dicitrate binding protein FerR (iron transport regulator)